MNPHERLDELRDLLEARTRLLHDAAHELKNPLAVVHGYAAALAERRDFTPEDLRKALRAIQSNAERAIALVDQLQDCARAESRTGRLSTGDCDPAALLEEAAVSAEVEAARRGVTLRWTSPIAPLPSVRADARRAAQVLANLVGNALKFTPAGGVVELSARAEAGGVVFSVCDTGPGIAAGDLPRLFERFYQSGADEHRRQGLGLGLAISKSLVEAQGGRIWAESRPGKGARLRFTLPLASAAPPATDPASTRL